MFEERLLLGAGIGFRRELFRLNDESRNLPVTAPITIKKGVGEESSTIAKFTVGFRATDEITIEGYFGTTVDGEFRLEDKRGNKIASSDYDDSGFGGVNLRFGF